MMCEHRSSKFSPMSEKSWYPIYNPKIKGDYTNFSLFGKFQTVNTVIRTNSTGVRARHHSLWSSLHPRTNFFFISMSLDKQNVLASRTDVLAKITDILASGIHVPECTTDVLARRTDVLASRTYIPARWTDVWVRCKDIQAIRTNVLACRTDFVVSRTDILARRTDVLTSRTDV